MLQVKAAPNDTAPWNSQLKSFCVLEDGQAYRPT